MTRFSACFLLMWSALATAAPRDPASPESVQVRFGNLYWVGAKTLLPRVLGGVMLTPPLETCDLLGLECTLSGKTLEAKSRIEPFNEQIFTVTPLYAEKIPMTALAPLVKLAGQNIIWDNQNKLALVSGGLKNYGWRYAFPSPATPQPDTYLGPLRASQTVPTTGQPNVQQLIFAQQALKNVTFYSKRSEAITMIGEFTPGTPDHPNKTVACPPENPKICELPVPRDALWTLAYASKP